MLLAADKQRRKKDKAQDAEAAPERLAFEAKCKERAEALRGLIGALVPYEEGGGRHGFLVSVHPSGMTAKVRRIMPLGCKAAPEIMTLACAQIEAKDAAPNRPRKNFGQQAPPIESTPAPPPEDVGGYAQVDSLGSKDRAAVNLVIQGAAADVEKAAALAGKPAASEFTAKAVELYRANPGIKIGDLAVMLGYVRGQGQNRTRTALRAAGLLSKI